MSAIQNEFQKIYDVELKAVEIEPWFFVFEEYHTLRIKLFPLPTSCCDNFSFFCQVHLFTKWDKKKPEFHHFLPIRSEFIHHENAERFAKDLVASINTKILNKLRKL